MNINIQMISPINSQRQVAVNSSIDLLLTSDTVVLNIDSLNIKINNIVAIENGQFKVINQAFMGPVENTRYITLTSSPDFILGEIVIINDGTNDFENTVLDINQNTLKLQNAINSVGDGYIKSASRGFTGTIVDDYTTLQINIKPLKDFNTNSIVLVNALVQDINSLTAKSLFSFRTKDTIPPQIFNFPKAIENSELSFRIVDILQNQIDQSKLNVLINNQFAIESGSITNQFTGTINPKTSSDFDIYLKPRVKYSNNQELVVSIETTDGYQNSDKITKSTTNYTKVPQIQVISITPIEESVLDPLNCKIQVQIRTDIKIPMQNINVSQIIDGQTNPETQTFEYLSIKRGQFVENETGILTSDRDIFIQLDRPKQINYNQNLKIRVFFQELDENLDPLEIYFDKEFSFSTVSSRLGPNIDQFKPAAREISSPTAQISFRILSLINRDPVDLQSINVAVNNILAIDQGIYTSQFTGEIRSVVESFGNCVFISVRSLVDYQIGSTVQVQIQAKDMAGNLTIEDFNFIIVDTNIPTVTIDPPGNIYNKPLRITISADQPSQILYTIDGSVPQKGTLNTFTGESPVKNVPVFTQGLTQVKAIAINSANIQSSVVTEIYDVNQYPPVINITSPNDLTVQDITTITIVYDISLQRGYLSKVEHSLNNGPLVDVNNTLISSSILVTGLISGTNTIQIIATDNSGNVGISQVRIVLNPSKIKDFTLKFAPLSCPKFPYQRVINKKSTFNDFIDTRTVTIIGYGRRVEALVSFAIGNGEDGQSINFDPAQPKDGRHFQFNSFPVVNNSLSLILTRKRSTGPIPTRDYVLDRQTGRVILDHPLETGETLVAEYISEADINSPEIFTSDKLGSLFIKHGEPSSTNCLSLAAQMAFENGATRVLAIQPDSFINDYNWAKTFKRLEKEELYSIVPVLSNENLQYYYMILENSLQHVVKMSRIENRKERRVIGARLYSTDLNIYQSESLTLVDLDLKPKVYRVVGGENQELNVTFVAAATAGLESSLANLAFPLTNKNLVGFKLNTRSRSPITDLDKIIDQGFLPVQALTSGGSIYRGRTSTLTGNPILEEMSVQRTIIYVSKNLRKLLEDNFKGRDINNSLIKEIASETNMFFNKNTSIISKGITLSVAVDILDPRQINVLVSYSPLFPLNEFNITFTVSTGL